MTYKTTDEIYIHFKNKYKEFSETHLKYINKEIDDFELGDNLKGQIESLERECDSYEYILDKPIGSGAFGTVFKGIYRKYDDKIELGKINKQNGKINIKYVAIKIIDLEESKDDIITIRREILALTEGKSCKQLTQYYGSDVYGTKLWIAMEWINGGSLYDLINIKPLHEKYISIICREVLKGLTFLEKQEKIHRDIKSANILIDIDGNIKLGDFGATGQLTATAGQCDTFVGSPYWMAPEVMTQNGYNSSADIWSLGITCIELAKGKPPLSHLLPFRVLMLIPKNPVPRLKGEQFSEQFKDFIGCCLVKDPEKRTKNHLLLKHPFIENSGNTSLLKAIYEKYQKAKDNGQEPSSSDDDEEEE